MGWLIAGAVVGIIGAFTGGIGKIANRAIQEKETKKELATAKSNLENSYSLSVKQLNETEQLEISQAIANRDITLTQRAQGMEIQNQIYNEQQAELAVKASQAEGQAIQQVATSGFRDTGSAMNVVNSTNTAYDLAIAKQNNQIALEKYENYNTALNNYTNANMQLEQYKLQIQQKRESMEHEYQTDLNAINDDINYMNSDEFKWAQAFGYIGDIGGATVDTMSSLQNYNNAKSQYSSSSSSSSGVPYKNAGSSSYDWSSKLNTSRVSL